MASTLLHIWQRFQCHHGQVGCPILAIRAKRMAVACSWANSWTCEVQTWVLTEDSHCPDRFLSAHFQHFSTILPWWNPTLVKYIAWIQDVHDQTFILRINSQYSLGIFVAIQSLFILFFLSPQGMHNPKFPHTCLGTRAYHIEVIANKTEQEFLSISVGILFVHPFLGLVIYLFAQRQRSSTSCIPSSHPEVFLGHHGAPGAGGRQRHYWDPSAWLWDQRFHQEIAGGRRMGPWKRAHEKWSTG